VAFSSRRFLVNVFDDLEWGRWSRRQQRCCQLSRIKVHPIELAGGDRVLWSVFSDYERGFRLFEVPTGLLRCALLDGLIDVHPIQFAGG